MTGVFIVTFKYMRFYCWLRAGKCLLGSYYKCHHDTWQVAVADINNNNDYIHLNATDFLTDVSQLIKGRLVYQYFLCIETSFLEFKLYRS